MSFLSSHVAFAYRLSDSQCHNNNEIKRTRSKSLFTFNCNTDEVPAYSSPVKHRRKSSPDGPGCVKRNHRDPHRDQSDVVFNTKQMKSESNPAALIQKLRERRMGSTVASDTMTARHAVSIISDYTVPVAALRLICLLIGALSPAGRFGLHMCSPCCCFSAVPMHDNQLSGETRRGVAQ